MEKNETVNAQKEFSEALETTFHFFFHDHQNQEEFELLHGLLDTLIGCEVNSARCNTIADVKNSQFLHHIFSRIINCPEGNNFLRFFLGKVMYVSSNSNNNILDRFGEETAYLSQEEGKNNNQERAKTETRKQLATFGKELWDVVTCSKFKMCPPLVKKFCQILFDKCTQKFTKE
jgi:hypothetical protein